MSSLPASTGPGSGEGEVIVATAPEGLGEQRRVVPGGREQIAATPHTEHRLPDASQDGLGVVVGLGEQPRVRPQAGEVDLGVAEQ